MTVHISQRLTCDMCNRDIRHLEQEVKNGAVPQIIQRDYILNHSGAFLDVCNTCFPSLRNAFDALKLAEEADQ